MHTVLCVEHPETHSLEFTLCNPLCDYEEEEKEGSQTQQTLSSGI